MSDLCPECGHEIAMHVKGSSPRYAGCMVRLDLDPPREHGRRRTCWCALTPDECRKRLAEAVR